MLVMRWPDGRQEVFVGTSASQVVGGDGATRRRGAEKWRESSDRVRKSNKESDGGREEAEAIRRGVHWRQRVREGWKGRKEWRKEAESASMSFLEPTSPATVPKPYLLPSHASRGERRARQP